eukprot:COSAG01_NODE_12830_length_1679_cov_6.206412_2_plen_100_part_00
MLSGLFDQWDGMGGLVACLVAAQSCRPDTAMAMAVVWLSPMDSLSRWQYVGRAGRLLVEAVALSNASAGAGWAGHGLEAPRGSYDRWMAMQVSRYAPLD